MYVTPVVSICRPCAGSSIHMPEQRSAGKCIVRASFHEHGNFYNNLAGYLILSTHDSCSFYTLRAEQSYPTFAVRLVAPLRRIMSSGEAPRTTIHLNTTRSHNSSYTKQLSFASKHLLYIFDTIYDYWYKVHVYTYTKTRNWLERISKKIWLQSSILKYQLFAINKRFN